MDHRVNKTQYRDTVLVSGTAILLGGLIYLFIRPVEPRFLEWLRTSGLSGMIARLRPEHPGSGYSFPEWIVYSLPGGLWAFAYALILVRIWTGKTHWIRYIWFSTLPLLVIGFEFLQKFGSIPGTFSKTDLLLGCIGAAAGVLAGTPGFLTNQKEI